MNLASDGSGTSRVMGSRHPALEIQINDFYDISDSISLNPSVNHLFFSVSTLSPESRGNLRVLAESPVRPSAAIVL